MSSPVKGKIFGKDQKLSDRNKTKCCFSPKHYYYEIVHYLIFPSDLFKLENGEINGG